MLRSAVLLQITPLKIAELVQYFYLAGGCCLVSGTHLLYLFVRWESESGIDGISVRPGCLKGAFNTLSDTEQSIVEACLRLSADTGFSVHIHTEPTVDAEDLISTLDRLCEKTGATHERVHICHMDNRLLAGTMVTDFLEDLHTQRALELDAQKALLDRGYSIGLDTWGMPIQNENLFMPDDFDRLKALIMLLDSGYEDQITLGNDFSNKIEWRQFGGYGCTRFADFGLRLLDLLGREEQAHKPVYENPARSWLIDENRLQTLLLSGSLFAGIL